MTDKRNLTDNIQGQPLQHKIMKYRCDVCQVEFDSGHGLTIHLRRSKSHRRLRRRQAAATAKDRKQENKREPGSKGSRKCKSCPGVPQQALTRRSSMRLRSQHLAQLCKEDIQALVAIIDMQTATSALAQWPRLSSVTVDSMDTANP